MSVRAFVYYFALESNSCAVRRGRAHARIPLPSVHISAKEHTGRTRCARRWRILSTAADPPWRLRLAFLPSDATEAPTRCALRLLATVGCPPRHHPSAILDAKLNRFRRRVADHMRPSHTRLAAMDSSGPRTDGYCVSFCKWPLAALSSDPSPFSAHSRRSLATPNTSPTRLARLISRPRSKCHFRHHRRFRRGSGDFAERLRITCVRRSPPTAR